MSKSTIQSTFETLDQLQQICLVLDNLGNVTSTSKQYNQLLTKNSKVLEVIQEKVFANQQYGRCLNAPGNSFELTLSLSAGFRYLAYVQAFREETVREETDREETDRDAYHHLVLLQPAAVDFLAIEASSSQRDYLTGLSNRWKLRAVEERLEQASKLKAISVAFIDINDLKCVNDNFGHAVGDAYIKIFADIMREYSRPEDALVRYGGDEFIGVYMGMTAKLLDRRMSVINQELLSRFRAYFEKHVLGKHVNGKQVDEKYQEAELMERFSGLCLGFAYGIERMVQGRTLTETIQRADAKMYAMKAKKCR